MNQYFNSMKEEWVSFVSKAITCQSLSGHEEGCADLFLNEMKKWELSVSEMKWEMLLA